MNCTICIENYNKKDRKEVSCNFCKFTACTKCICRYLLTQSNESHCMSCKHEWDIEFVYKHLTKAFINGEYKHHKQQILFEKEKSLLPSAQLELEKIELIHEKGREIEEISKYLQLKMRELADFKSTGVVERKKFIRQCPVNDCRGFLSSNLVCGICKTKACKDCREPIPQDNEHKCDPDTVESIKLLNSDSKPCPNCACSIFKISGCDQMFCVECHTAFSWKTGQIEHGIIHNPHYYAWQRENGQLERNPNDVRCGGVVQIHQVLNVVRKTALKVHLLNYHRTIGHYEHVARNLSDLQYNPQIDMDLRLKFLKKETDETGWKKTLYMRYKRRNNEYRLKQIYNTYTTVVAEILGQCSDRTISAEEALESCHNILKYCNNQLFKISKLFGTKSRVIEEVP